MINNFMFQFLRWIVEFKAKEDFVKDGWMYYFKRLNKDNLINLETIYEETYRELREKDYISIHNDLINITPAGREAYSIYLNEIAMPNASLRISLESLDNERDSVNIAREANKLSKEANKKSGRANCISFVAALFTLAGLIISIIALLK